MIGLWAGWEAVCLREQVMVAGSRQHIALSDADTVPACWLSPLHTSIAMSKCVED